LNLALIQAAVSGLLSLAGVVIPMIPGGNSAAVGGIISAVKEIIPVVTDLGPVAIQGVKNVIAALSSHPATTQEQMTELASLDKQVDDAWNSVHGDFDPDASPPGSA
jgi:hypothetical protein